MADLKARLSEVLHSIADTHSIVAIAATDAESTHPRAVWSPQAGHEEPAFLVYSITKTFTATLLLLLTEERRLSLDDPLPRWFPRIQSANRITLRQLLNHTAGIPDYGGLRSYHDELRSLPSRPWSFERFAEETFDKGLSFEPGAGWAYSNPAYMLLKRIAEEVTGTTFASLIADRIAQPLGLTRTFVPVETEHLVSLAPAMSRALAVDATPRDVRHDYHPDWVSHGVVAATPSDIVRFLDALFAHQLVSERSLDEMTLLVSVPVPSRATTPDREYAHAWRQPSYGLGLMGDPASRWGVVLGHNGGGPGYSASAFHVPGLGGVSVCAIGADESFRAEDAVFRAFNLFEGKGDSA